MHLLFLPIGGGIALFLLLDFGGVAAALGVLFAALAADDLAFLELAITALVGCEKGL